MLQRLKRVMRGLVFAASVAASPAPRPRPRPRPRRSSGAGEQKCWQAA